MDEKEYNELLARILMSRMGVNPLISVGAPVAGNIISALVANQARRRAQERLNSLQRPTLPAFRRNPLLGQRIAQQQQLADQPMMGYQRFADEQAARQFERGRQIAAGLGGGAGLAYMQGVSSSIADQQRRGLLNDMAMQQRNRAELDQLINMQNQELAQEREREQLEYQIAMRDFMDQRSRLQSDVGQQQSNIAASLGGIVGDIPNYVTAFRNYNMVKDMTKGDKKEKKTDESASKPFLRTGPVAFNLSTTPSQAMLSRLNYGNTPLLNNPPSITDLEYSLGINPYRYSLNQVPFSEMDVPQEAYEFFPERRRFPRMTMSPVFR
jgi:hypothetical protein